MYQSLRAWFVFFKQSHAWYSRAIQGYWYQAADQEVLIYWQFLTEHSVGFMQNEKKQTKHTRARERLRLTLRAKVYSGLDSRNTDSGVVIKVLKEGGKRSHGGRLQVPAALFNMALITTPCCLARSPRIRDVSVLPLVATPVEFSSGHAKILLTSARA